MAESDVVGCSLSRCASWSDVCYGIRSHAVQANNVIVRGVTVDSPGINHDGVDADSSVDVLIQNNTFRVGDDCVAIKSGRDADGWRVGRTCTTIKLVTKSPSAPLPLRPSAPRPLGPSAPPPLRPSAPPPLRPSAPPPLGPSAPRPLGPSAPPPLSRSGAPLRSGCGRAE